MRLIHNWRAIVRRAWSFWLIIAAIVLQGLDAALPYLQGWLPFSPPKFGLLTFVVTVLAIPARLIAQRGLSLPERATDEEIWG